METAIYSAAAGFALNATVFAWIYLARGKATRITRTDTYLWLRKEIPEMKDKFLARVRHTSGLTQRSMMTAYDQAIADICVRLAGTPSQIEAHARRSVAPIKASGK